MFMHTFHRLLLMNLSGDLAAAAHLRSSFSREIAFFFFEFTDASLM